MVNLPLYAENSYSMNMGCSLHNEILYHKKCYYVKVIDLLQWDLFQRVTVDNRVCERDKIQDDY